MDMIQTEKSRRLLALAAEQLDGWEVNTTLNGLDIKGQMHGTAIPETAGLDKASFVLLVLAQTNKHLHLRKCYETHGKRQVLKVRVVCCFRDVGGSSSLSTCSIRRGCTFGLNFYRDNTLTHTPWKLGRGECENICFCVIQ